MSDLTVPLNSLLNDLRSRTPVGPLSRQKDQQIERGFLGLYRWYASTPPTARRRVTGTRISRSTGASFATNFSDLLMEVLQGYFAIGYYTPDYVNEILNLVRRSHGRSHAQLRWGEALHV